MGLKASVSLTLGIAVVLSVVLRLRLQQSASAKRFEPPAQSQPVAGRRSIQSWSLREQQERIKWSPRRRSRSATIAVKESLRLSPDSRWRGQSNHSLPQPVPIPPLLAASQADLGNSPSDSRVFLPSSTEELSSTAWVLIGRPRSSGFIYFPALATLVEGFAAYGFQVKVRYVEDTCAVRESSAAAAKHNISSIVISISWQKVKESRHPQCEYVDTLRQMAVDYNAYVIIYNTEPKDRVYRSVTPFAQQVNAAEIWDYSEVILAKHTNASLDMPQRYMPAGCAKTMDFGTRMDTAEKDLNAVGFVGNWDNRAPTTRRIVDLFLHGRVNFTVEVRDAAAVRAWLERYPVELNVRSHWNLDRAFEGFRAALMLANRACVISQIPDAVEQRRWRGMVQFMQWSDMREFVKTMRNNPSKIRKCQEQSSEAFCKEFQPVDLFERSGFGERLLLLRSRNDFVQASG